MCLRNPRSPRSPRNTLLYCYIHVSSCNRKYRLQHIKSLCMNHSGNPGIEIVIQGCKCTGLTYLEFTLYCFATVNWGK